MDQDDHHYETLSLRARRKKSSMSLSCCFHGRLPDSFYMIPSPNSGGGCGRSPSSSAGLKGRYKNLISRMGRHRRHASAEFSYDPLSYSRNFEDANDHHRSYEVDDFPVPSFSSRLPLSPRRSSSPSSANRNQNQDHHQLPGREAAVAQVRRSLEGEEVESPPGQVLNPWKVQEMTRDNADRLNIPTPRKVKTKMATPETSTTRSINHELLTPPSRGAAEVRRSYDYEEVSPALVVSPTSRQVLVELC